MMIGTALRNHLLGDPSIAAMVGGEVYPYALGESVVMPAVSLFEVTADDLEDMEGPTGQKVARWQFSAWSEDDEGAARLRSLIKDRLLGASGELGAVGGSPPQEGVHVGHVARGRDYTLRDQEDRIFQQVVEMTIFYWGES